MLVSLVQVGHLWLLKRLAPRNHQPPKKRPRLRRLGRFLHGICSRFGGSGEGCWDVKDVEMWGLMVKTTWYGQIYPIIYIYLQGFHTCQVRWLFGISKPSVCFRHDWLGRFWKRNFLPMVWELINSQIRWIVNYYGWSTYPPPNVPAPEIAGLMIRVY